MHEIHRTIGIMVCILVHNIHGNLNLVADCGEPADVGDSVLLTCSIHGTLSFSITWKRVDEPVATCFQDRKCKSHDLSRYQVGDDHHPSSMQQVTIINATDSDFLSRFTCCDGMDCNDSSTCRLKKKTWATTEADCGERATLGKSTVIKCMVSSQIHNGIRWYRNQILIVQCDTEKNCKSLDDRFVVFKRHDDKNQQVIIKNVSIEDLQSQFTCVDNLLIPPSLPLTSTCRLTQYYETSTMVNCGKTVQLGDTVEMTCTVLGKLSYGVTWFRGDDGIIRCSQSYECYSTDISRYSFSINGNTIRLYIRNASMVDLNKAFSCLDSPELPLVVQPESTCNLKIETGATTEADCGERATLGKSTVIKCMVSSQIHNGIRWYRNQILIVQCDTEKNCKSVDDRFVVFKRHDDKNQQVIIKDVSIEDLQSQFTCVDNLLIPPSLPLTSTCRLTQYYETSTTVSCSKTVQLGGTFEMTCTVLGKLSYGVTWFRGDDGIIRCSQSYECYSTDISRYSFSINGNTIRLYIRNASMVDLNKAFSCLDSPELPLVVQPESTCNLKIVTSSAEPTVLYHTLPLVLAATVVLFQL